MISNYKDTDRMIDLIEDNYRLLQVISRFGMSLGFGDDTVQMVCQRHKVDCTTFLAIINFVNSGYTQVACSPEMLSIPTLINYLRQSHRYFLGYLFPQIHRRLHEVVREDGGTNQISRLIHHQLDAYISQVGRHMRYEAAPLFPYVEALMRGELNPDFNVVTFSKRHSALDDSLRELKRILIQYKPDYADATELNAVLYQIYGCEDELDSHCKAEDYIFVPAVYHLEEKVRHAQL